MAENAIQAVRQAELDAAGLEKETAEKRKQMLLQVQQDLMQDREGLKRESAAEAEAALKKAAGQSEAMMQEAAAEAEKAIAGLHLQAKGKEKEAVRLILDELFS